MNKLGRKNMVQPTDYWGNNILDQLSYGHSAIINMATESGDITIGSLGVQSDPQYFKIIPETAGVIKVVLAGADDDETKVFTITAAQVTAWIGKPMPFLIYKVLKTGTTATFSAVW